MGESDLLTRGQAEKYLNISTSTFHRLRREGKIKQVQLAPNTIRYRRSDLDALIEASIKTDSQGSPEE